jgi:heavy metal-binding protein
VPNPDFQNSGMSHDMSKMPGMDHSKMKEMPMPAVSVTASPAGKEAVEGEMKKTSDEMKTLSDELKAKSDAAKSDKKTGDKSTANEPSPAAAVYTCTMHHEVNLPAPGKCPKCGMTLVKKESGAK